MKGTDVQSVRNRNFVVIVIVRSFIFKQTAVLSIGVSEMFIGCFIGICEYCRSVMGTQRECGTMRVRGTWG